VIADHQRTVEAAGWLATAFAYNCSRRSCARHINVSPNSLSANFPTGHTAERAAPQERRRWFGRRSGRITTDGGSVDSSGKEATMGGQSGPEAGVRWASSKER